MRADYPVNSGIIDAPRVGMVVGVIGCPFGSQSVRVFVEEAIPHQGKEEEKQSVEFLPIC